MSAIYFQLKHVKLVEITLEWLQAQVPVLLMRRNIVSTVRDLVTDLGRTKAGSEMEENVLHPVVAAFESYKTFTAEFINGQGLEDPVDEFKRRKNCESKVSNLLTDLLYDVLSGVYDPALTEARAANEKSATCQVTMDNDVLLKAKGFDKYRELYRLVTVAQSNVDLHSSGVPDSGARQLRRYASESQGGDEEQAEAERRDAFEAIHKHREQFVEFRTANDRVMTTTKYQQLFEQSKAYTFEHGRSGETHRLFVFSAELFHEAGDAPWAAATEWAVGMETVLDFFSGKNGSIDATVAFDGRSRACRKNG